MIKYRAWKATVQNKAVNNAYVRHYRERMASPNQKAKHNAHVRNYSARVVSPNLKANIMHTKGLKQQEYGI